MSKINKTILTVMLLAGLIHATWPVSRSKIISTSPQAITLNSNPPGRTVSTEPMALPQKKPNTSDSAAWQLKFWDIFNEPPAFQSESVEDLAGALPADQIVPLLDYLAREKTGPLGDELAQLLVRRWAQKSPADAAAWIHQLSGGNLATHLAAQLMAPWAAQDPDAALAWTKQLPPGDLQASAKLALANEIANENNPTVAIDLLADAAPGIERNKVLAYAVTKWAAGDQEQALAWANSVPDEILRTDLISRIAVEYGIQNPAAAADLISTALPAGQSQNEAALEIVLSWAATSPEDAAKWVAQFPDGPLRANAMANLMDIWGNQNPEAALAWITAPAQTEDLANYLSAHASAP